MPKTATDRLSAYDRDTKQWNVVIETPKGCRNKFKYDETAGVFALSGVLPAGAVFPFDFGYIPSTLGDDGDPLDVLLLMDEPAFVGCLVPCRLIGVIEAKQTERDGKTTRNDRLIAVPLDSQDMKDVKTIRDLNDNMLEEIQHFFVSYNQIRGKKFKPLGVHGPTRAEKLARQGMRAHEKKG
jgi:inorganic pyrophosphatase